MRRYDPRPLVQLVAAGYRPDSQFAPDRPTDEWLAESFGVTRTTVCRWRAGRTTWTTWDADRHAVRFGLHPMNVWPNWGGS